MAQINLFIFTFLITNTGVLSDISLEMKKDFFNIYKGIAVIQKSITHTNVTRDQITFHMYRKESKPMEAILDDTNLQLLEDTKGHLVFITHGWGGEGNDEWIINLKESFLHTYPDAAVITVDWKGPANQLYYVSSISVDDIGNFIADMIVNLLRNHKVSLSKIILVGHSLGGQASGFAGKKLRKLGYILPRIIALDPAGPLFDVRPIDERLNPSDAEVVEVIHSDAGSFGYYDSCGTIDFFPNGGNFQPGCTRIDVFDPTSLVDPLICDHQRAYLYFIEAVLYPKNYLVATQCSNWSFLRKTCNPNITAAMGDLTTQLRGNFYLETNKERPYNKKEVMEPTGLLDKGENAIKRVKGLFFKFLE